MTSAPRSARCREDSGAATACSSAITRRPASGSEESTWSSSGMAVTPVITAQGRHGTGRLPPEEDRGLEVGHAGGEAVQGDLAELVDDRGGGRVHEPVQQRELDDRG